MPSSFNNSNIPNIDEFSLISRLPFVELPRVNDWNVHKFGLLKSVPERSDSSLKVRSIRNIEYKSCEEMRKLEWIEKSAHICLRFSHLLSSSLIAIYLPL